MTVHSLLCFVSNRVLNWSICTSGITFEVQAKRSQQRAADCS